MAGPEAPRQFVEVRSVKPRIFRQPFLTGRLMFELAREAFAAPRTESTLHVDPENRVISVRRELKALVQTSSK